MPQHRRPASIRGRAPLSSGSARSFQLRTNDVVHPNRMFMARLARTAQVTFHAKMRYERRKWFRGNRFLESDRWSLMMIAAAIDFCENYLKLVQDTSVYLKQHQTNSVRGSDVASA